MTVRTFRLPIALGMLLASGCGESKIREGDSFSLFLVVDGDAYRAEADLSMGECYDRMQAENARTASETEKSRQWYCQRQPSGNAM